MDFIKSIAITGFKCFEEKTTVPFSKLTVLAGANSVGKSSVIQCILLTRIAEGSGQNERIALNEEYLLNLGLSKNILNNKHSGSKTLKIEYSLINNTLAHYYLDKTGEIDNFLFLTMKSGQLFTPEETLHHKGFYYLCAERLGPRLFFEKPVQTFEHCGWRGEYTVAVLDQLKNALDIPEKKRLNKDFSKLKFQLESWMDFIIPGISLDAIELPEINRTRIEYGGYTPHNVGFGISYVLPIVVTCLIAAQNSMVIVENPEAHLHPLGQSRMGQFLAQMATSDIQIVVETHSEHLINGMRIAAVDKENAFAPSDIAINFFTKDADDNAIVTNIEIDERGELSDWPDGFFDQAEQDYLTILKLRKA